jgi:hypothetical protein
MDIGILTSATGMVRKITTDMGHGVKPGTLRGIRVPFSSNTPVAPSTQAIPTITTGGSPHHRIRMKTRAHIVFAENVRHPEAMGVASVLDGKG